MHLYILIKCCGVNIYMDNMCIGGKFVLTGAQEAETYADVIRQAAQLPAA